MKYIHILVIALLIIPSSLAYTIKDYPEMFVKNNRLEVKLVVGDVAVASDTIGAVEIATSLQVNPTTNKVFRGIKAVLASEIYDVKSENIIAIGGPCANGVTAELMGYPAVCYGAIPSNTGIIRLYKFSNHFSLVVAGSSAMDTRRACRVLANYFDYNLPSSDYMEVINTNEKEISVN